jgi:RTX calcium-binding nonapeptide repeat (4 copies)
VSVTRRAAVLPTLAFALSVGVVLTGSTIVPASKAGRSARGISANDLKPSSCSALALNGIRTGSGTFNDSSEPHLVLGSAGVDTIRGQGGDDCILGGAGSDTLRGDGGTDVCIGGAGVDTFNASCETQIQ